MKNSQNNKNFFILFEGVDGSGKTTVSKMLAELLGAVYLNSPPASIRFLKHIINSHTPIKIRFWYFLLGNYILSFKIKKIIKKQPVVLDKYIYSTIVTHSVLLNKKLHIPRRIEEPSHIVYLFAEWSEIDKRLNLRKNRNKFEEIIFLKEADKVYRKFLSDTKTIFKNTTNKNPIEVANDIFHLINSSD